MFEEWVMADQNSRMYNEGRLKDASILCEIRDLLTKMANPVVTVSLESTPESRAARRAEKMAEMEEGCSVTAGSLDDDIFYRKVEEMKAHHGGTPVNDGSEAADDRDRALGRAVSGRRVYVEQVFTVGRDPSYAVIKMPLDWDGSTVKIIEIRRKGEPL